MTKKQGKILIIDDNEELLIAFRLFLQPHFKDIKTITNPNQLPALVKKEDFDVFLLDMNFNAGVNTGNEGLYWMREILKAKPDAVIILITAYGDVELAVKAMKDGAADFIQKSWNEDKILKTILNTYNKRTNQNTKTTSLKSKESPSVCWGKSQAMKDVYTLIQKVAKTDANILVLGESGTGKEVVARQIHLKSARVNKRFVSVDVGALPETLFESEIFGSRKGAFTDSKADRTGRFEMASGGTLFLDEIGNLPLNLQSKLLSAIQNKEVTPLGADKAIPVDIRLICATNKHLYKMVDDGDFREDLLYRINTIQIELPPLRNRTGDIPQLVDFFIEKFTQKYRKTSKSINKSAIDFLLLHNWPGNIRELEHTIEKAVILSEDKEIDKSDIFFDSKRTVSQQSGEIVSLEENEKNLIERALIKYKGNISRTAKVLGINRSTLYEKIKKYEL